MWEQDLFCSSLCESPHSIIPEYMAATPDRTLFSHLVCQTCANNYYPPKQLNFQSRIKVSSLSGSKSQSDAYDSDFPFQNQERPPRWALILLALLCIMAVCCSPALGARDVRVALTELRPSLFTDEQGNPAGFLSTLSRIWLKKKVGMSSG